MYAVIVNRKLVGFQVYGPFTSASEAWRVGESLLQRDWIKTADRIELNKVSIDESGQLIFSTDLD